MQYLILTPKIGQVQANLKRAREIVRPIIPHSVDIVCFPEMVMSGYVFESASAITPYLELPHVGPTSQFCSELSNRLGCYVIAGYPERLIGEEAPTERPDGDEEEKPDSERPKTRNGDAHGTNGARKKGKEKPRIVGANSAVIYGPGGKYLGGYRKTNLFEIDKTWAKPGHGFSTFRLPFPPDCPPSQPSTVLTLSLGICMDLNVQPDVDWESLDGDPYELADHVIAEKVDVLVLLNAWLDSGLDPDSKNESDWATLHYWSERLKPLWYGSEPPMLNEDGSYSWDDSEEDGDWEMEEGDDFGEDWSTPSHREKSETVVIVCNRTGQEKGKLFAGSSAIFHMVKGSGTPRLLESMGRYEEGMRGWGLLL
ncbi:carbon-nitrogen hydrolase [Dendrothele bispora CBS 962.96]|uniref:Carbon-nitrogen hydrolase n=1 Tax=Dendrothele bispora (strain CBS 962.96) TaxID=1314807 RepID=A0A4S8M094_DENBC|nr:carbon-nitrogen hydrolase [Dendrothele bispora CBS 962.96]